MRLLPKIKTKKYRWAILCSPIIFFVLFLIADQLFPLPIIKLKTTQTILAEDGSPLWRFADEKGIWRYPVSLDDVPDYYIDALINYEDRWFYQHKGINPISFIRAAWQFVTNGRIISGGSTLSMQVARLIEDHDKTLLGKLQQIFRTLQLEWHYSKQDILTFYINRAPFGGTLEGIGAASWSYLGKSPKELTRSEAVLMSVLPQAPSRLRPDRYPERAQEARDKVLKRLKTFNVWPNAIIDEVYQESVWVQPRTVPNLAPLLARRLSRQYPQKDIIKTTINSSLQYTLEDMAINLKDQLPPKTSLALMVIDHTSMQVKAYIGSIDFNDNNRFGHVDMINAWRSPGSTLKPFLYGLALDDSLIHSESLLQDVPRFKTNYRPSNFDTNFSGPVSAAKSLARSLNLPSVQLLEIYGPKRFSTKLYSAGLHLLSTGSEPNLAYILGGTAVKMDQLLASYSAFARQGNVGKLRFTQDDPLIEKPLLSPGAAWIIRQILSGQSHPPIGKQPSDIVPLGWKTGTSYGYRDAWALGINPRYLIGVWVGRPDGTPVTGQYGNATAVPILQRINQILIHREYSLNHTLPTDPQPKSVSVATICWPSGQKLKKDDPNCHRQKRAWILNHTIPPTLDLLYELNNPLYRSGWQKIWVNTSGLRVAPNCPNAQEKDIALWPISLEAWLQPNERRSHLIPAVDKNCPIINENQHSELIITGMVDKQIVRTLPSKNDLTISLNSIGGFGQRWWFLNGELVANTPAGHKFSLYLDKKGKYQLSLMDESGQIDKISFLFE